MKICTTMKKFPGGMMVTPLSTGCLVDTFVPQVLEAGGFTTGLFKTGISTLVGLFILCSGVTTSFKQAILPLYKGAALTTLKYTIGVLLGLGLNRLFGPMGILGPTPLAVIIAVTNSNGAIYIALAKEFGGSTDVGAITILSLSDGPSLTMTALGTTGLAEILILSPVAAIAPLVIGMILGNLNEDFEMLLSNGSAMLLLFNGFMLGTSISLFIIAKAGVGGIVLGLITVLFTGVLTCCLYSLIRKKSDLMGMIIGTTEGNAAIVPVSVAMADLFLEPVVGVVTTQVAGAVIVIAIPTPTLTGSFARKATKRQQKN